MQVKKYKSLQYLYSEPDCSINEKHPLLIYMHGSGGRGHDIQAVHFPPYIDEYLKRNKKDMILCAPLCEEDNWYAKLESVIEWIKYMSNLENVDSDRIYIMGASMGGFATWALLMSIPEVFAAAAPLCGGGMTWNVQRIKNIPIWVMHGTADLAVDISESISMVNALRRCGGNVKFTVFSDYGHNVWNPAIDETNLIDWMLEHKKSDQSK